MISFFRNQRVSFLDRDSRQAEQLYNLTYCQGSFSRHALLTSQHCHSCWCSTLLLDQEHLCLSVFEKNLSQTHHQSTQ